MFTGSSRTGKAVMKAAADAPIPCYLELGGKDPMIVCSDADVCVNDAQINYTALHLPMGGWKAAGPGTRHGAAGIRNYIEVQSLLVTRRAIKRAVHVPLPQAPNDAPAAHVQGPVRARLQGLSARLGALERQHRENRCGGRLGPRGQTATGSVWPDGSGLPRRHERSCVALPDQEGQRDARESATEARRHGMVARRPGARNRTHTRLQQRNHHAGSPAR